MKLSDTIRPHIRHMGHTTFPKLDHFRSSDKRKARTQLVEQFRKKTKSNDQDYIFLRRVDFRHSPQPVQSSPRFAIHFAEILLCLCHPSSLFISGFPSETLFAISSYGILYKFSKRCVYQIYSRQ